MRPGGKRPIDQSDQCPPIPPSSSSQHGLASLANVGDGCAEEEFFGFPIYLPTACSNRSTRYTGEDLSVVYPTTHNDLAASEVGPLSNWDRTCMENEGWGGEGRIYNIENDIGIIILRFDTARRDPPSGTTTREIRSARGLARHGRKKPQSSMDTYTR